MNVVLLGIAGRTPFAGVAWQVLHYLEGFRRLGADVTYVEDTGDWPYDAERNTVTDDPAYTARYLGAVMSRTGLRWAYVAPDGRTFGLSRSELLDTLRQADCLINLTGGTRLREEHLAAPVRIYLETDPVLPQVDVAFGRDSTIELLEAHSHHFSFGENLGAEDCGVPVERFDYLPTRQPVVLDWWTPSASPAGRYTTVSSWRQERELEWQGETYFWTKDREFLAFLDLPRRVPVDLELALACDDREAIRLLESHGWRVTNAVALSRRLEPYRRFILDSRGEFTVAKDQNVRLRSGWFSDRSACYLAAAKPVVTQDTGFACSVPFGEGLFAVRDVEEAAAAVEAIERDYERHARAARAIAEQYFDAEKVLSSLLERAGLGVAVGR
jgi:hypothetical protein